MTMNQSLSRVYYKPLIMMTLELVFLTGKLPVKLFRIHTKANLYFACNFPNPYTYLEGFKMSKIKTNSDNLSDAVRIKFLIVVTFLLTSID